MSVASIILDQMGGMNKIRIMTGAKNFIAYKSESESKYGEGLGGVSFRFPRASTRKHKSKQRPNYVKIILDSSDTYNVTFGSIHGSKYKVLSEYEGVYASNLKKLFEDESGLYLSLNNNPSGDDYYEEAAEILKSIPSGDNYERWIFTKKWNEVLAPHGLKMEFMQVVSSEDTKEAYIIFDKSFKSRHDLDWDYDKWAQIEFDYEGKWDESAFQGGTAEDYFDYYRFFNRKRTIEDLEEKEALYYTLLYFGKKPQPLGPPKGMVRVYLEGERTYVRPENLFYQITNTDPFEWTSISGAEANKKGVTVFLHPYDAHQDYLSFVRTHGEAAAIKDYLNNPASGKMAIKQIIGKLSFDSKLPVGMVETIDSEFITKSPYEDDVVMGSTGIGKGLPNKYGYKSAPYRGSLKLFVGPKGTSWTVMDGGSVFKKGFVKSKSIRKQIQPIEDAIIQMLNGKINQNPKLSALPKIISYLDSSDVMNSFIKEYGKNAPSLGSVKSKKYQDRNAYLINLDENDDVFFYVIFYENGANYLEWVIQDSNKNVLESGTIKTEKVSEPYLATYDGKIYEYFLPLVDSLKIHTGNMSLRQKQAGLFDNPVDTLHEAYQNPSHSLAYKGWPDDLPDLDNLTVVDLEEFYDFEEGVNGPSFYAQNDEKDLHVRVFYLFGDKEDGGDVWRVSVEGLGIEPTIKDYYVEVEGLEQAKMDALVEGMHLYGQNYRFAAPYINQNPAASVSEEISYLMREKGYPHKRAVAAALNIHGK